MAGAVPQVLQLLSDFLQSQSDDAPAAQQRIDALGRDLSRANTRVTMLQGESNERFRMVQELERTTRQLRGQISELEARIGSTRAAQQAAETSSQ
jgi:chromosome segregation ATPase